MGCRRDCCRSVTAFRCGHWVTWPTRTRWGKTTPSQWTVPSLAPGCTPKNVVQPGNLQYLRPECFIYPVAPSQAFLDANCNQSTFGPIGPLGTPRVLWLEPTHLHQSSGQLAPQRDHRAGVVQHRHVHCEGHPHRQIRRELQHPVPRGVFQHLEPYELRGPHGQPGCSWTRTIVDGFGPIDQDTQVPMREIQFALKIVF